MARRLLASYLGWMVVLVVPLELFFRVTGLGALPRLEVNPEGHLLVPIPESRVIYRREGFSAFRFNARGLRGEPVTPERSPETLRVAFLGDSYTEGLQVPTRDTFVERFATEHGGAVEVLNFGMSGDNLGQQLVRYREEVRPYAPDLVVVGSTDGDLRDVLRHTERTPFRWDGQDVVIRDADLEWRAPESAATFRWRERLRGALESYAVLQRFRNLAKTAQGKLRRLRGVVETPKDAELIEKARVPQGAQPRYAAVLARLAREVTADGGTLVGMHLPKGFTLRDDRRAIALAYRQVYSQAGVPFLGTFEPLQGLLHARTWTHYGQPAGGGGHMTSAAHHEVARLMIEALRPGGAWSR